MYITLATRRDQVDFINERKLGELPGEEFVSHGKIEGDFPESSLPTQLNLSIKEQAQVIFIDNDYERRWVNGTIGMVSGIDENGNVYVLLEDGREYLVEPTSWRNYKYKYNEKEKKVEEEIVGTFEQLPIRGNDIVFLGNSITDGGEWAELFNNRHVKNRGISADRSGWLLDRLDPIINGHPKKLFLMIGTNDLAVGIAPEEVAANVEKLLDRFAEESPWTKIYVQSILPVNGVDTKAKPKNHWKKGAEIIETNKLLETLCEGRKNVMYVDVYSALVDEKGMLDKQYTNDGLHLMGEGYLAWKTVIEKFVR